MGINGYPPPPPNGTNMAGMNGMNGMNNMGLTAPLMESVFGRHPAHHQRHHGAPAGQGSMPLPPVRRGGAPSSMTVSAPKGMHRPQPKPGHTAKKNDGKSTGPWSHKEHQQFEKSVIIFGWGNWVQVRSKIPGRTKDQCKSHAQKFAKHHPAEKARLDREHEAYCRLQSQQRHSFPNVAAQTKVPVIHSKNTQMETLPGAGKSDTPGADDNAEKGDTKLPSLPPPPKHGGKSKSSSSLKASSPPAKKKVVVKPKLPTRTGHKLPSQVAVAPSLPPSHAIGAMSQGAARDESNKLNAEKVLQEELMLQQQKLLEEQQKLLGEEKKDEAPAEEQKQEQSSSVPTADDDDDDDDMYEEPLPTGINTITPPTKNNREPEVLNVRNPEVESDQQREARELLAMSNTMNVDARLSQSREELPHQYEALQSKAAGSVASFSNKSPSTAKVSVDGPPVVHKPNDFDPESIDTICAEIYERKQQNGCTKFPLCLCNQTPCAKKSLTSSLRIKKASYQKSL